MRLSKVNSQQRIFFFIIPFVTGIIYFLSFFPGIITFDSVNQWVQLSTFHFTNWHPAYHTIIMWLITRLWYSPAIFTFFQVLVCSIIICYGFSIFLEYGVPFYLLVIGAIIISIIPQINLIIITLWKDVLFSFIVLLSTLYLFRMIQTQGKWISSGNNWVYFGFAAANVVLLRHNGFPVAIGTFLTCLVFRDYRKYVIKSFVFSLLYVLLIIGPIYRIFKVDNSFRQPASIVFVHPIAAHITAETSLNPDETKLLDEIYSLDKGWPYSCYDATVLFYEGVNFQLVQENPKELAKIFFRLTIEDPKVTLKHFFCLSSFVWQITQPDGVFFESALTYNVDVSNYPNWTVYKSYIDQDPRLPGLKNTVITIIHKIDSIDKGNILERPAIYFYAFTLILVFLYLRKHDKKIFLLLVPDLIQSSIIAFTAQLQALRYQFPVYLTTLLFSLPLIYIAIKLPNSDGSKSNLIAGNKEENGW